MMNQASSVNDPAQVLATYMGRPQCVVLQSLMDGSEESGFFKEIAAHLRRSVEAMPTAGGQRLDEEAPMVYLHYFLGASDVWVLEKAEGGGVEQVFAFSLLNGDHQMAELGYVDLSELLLVGFELDFHFEPKPLSEVRESLRKRFGLF